MMASQKLRSTALFLFFCCAYAIIVVNLYIIQVAQHQFYTQMKHRQYYTTITTTPSRGPILDRTGNHYLALNKQSLSAFILPKNLESPETLLPFLEQYFPKSAERFELYRHKSFMYIQRRLNPEHIDLINNANIVDIKLLEEPNRYYPIACAGTLIGITDIDNNGLFGIEHYFNEHLSGKPTTVTLARDARAHHFYFSKQTTVCGHEGKALQLTIDSSLQYIVAQELKNAHTKLQAQESAALVIDPQSGDILALVNIPDFDPNSPEAIDLEATKNNIIVDTYELGSVIKVFAALAALEEGVVTPDEIIDCKNTKTAYIDGRRINTVYPGGLLTFSQVIEQSNNIGIAQITKRLGTRLYDHYLRLGFGQKTMVPFPGEQKGFVNPPDQWSKQSLISLSYGYEMRCSILQLAKAFCIIARDGYDAPLRLTMDETISRDSWTPLYSAASIATIKDILERTTIKRRWQKTPLEQYRIMSKTGTANMLVNGEYDNHRNLFTCVGLVEHPTSPVPYQRVIVVFIKEIPKKNVYAATIAAPVFDAIAEKVVIHDKAL